jgi:beta-glucosidase
MTTSAPADLDTLIGSLGLAAKVRLLTGATAFTLAPEESIGLGELRLSDGPTGVRGLKFSGGRTVALFPNATLLASAWDEDAAGEVGRMLAEEAMAQEIHVVLGPTINLHRSVLGGRLFEAYSEDPLLTGKLAAAYVRGLQDLGVAACLKHLVANESETERSSMNSVVDEATLRELYLLPFEIAVAESDPWSVMAAYNDVNGVPATEHVHVNTEVLKGEWGWTGLLMSDWFATKSAGPAAAGGLDLVMPGPEGPWGDALVAAVRDGEIAESVVDEHLRRLLVLARRVGALGDLREYPADLPAPDSAVRTEQLTRLAAAGITVLTNDGTLPLARGTRVSLVGRHAVETIDMGGGSAQVNPPYQVSVAEGLTALLGDDVVVVDGVEVRTRAVPARPEHVADPETGEAGVHVTLLGADGTVLDERHGAGPVVMVGLDDDLDQAVATVRFRARVAAGVPLEVGALGVGDWRLRVGDRSFDYGLGTADAPASDTPAPATADGPASDTPATATGTGGAGRSGDDIVEGAAILRPPTRTDEVVVTGDGLVEAEATPTTAVALFGLVVRPARRPAQEVLADAVRAAADADVAVVVVGLTEEQETESVDKTSIRLPGEQDALVGAVAAAARRTVVVVNAATPVLMPWLDEVDAVLWAGLPGQEGGHAVAAALLGDLEPAGRLVTTFPAAEGAAPAWSVTPVDGVLEYAEGTFIGYRGHHAGRAPAPAFWFGHGLGYATWEYSEASVSAGEGGSAGGADDDTPTVSVTIANTGDRVSREVVQVYLEPDAPDQPVRLVGWAAATVAPGASARVEVRTDAHLWRSWETATHAWGRLPAGGRLLVARGLGDVRATLDLPRR